MKRHTNKARLGFTLLELVVSIAILAMIAVMVSRIFSESSRAVGRGRSEALLDETARMLLDYLEEDISQALLRTNVAFRVHPNDSNDALYFISTGMRRQLETIPRDTAPMRWQATESTSHASALFPDWNRAASAVSPYGSASRTVDAISKLLEQSDYYQRSDHSTADFASAHHAERMTTTEKAYSEFLQDSRVTSHAVVTFLDITVNGSRNSHRTDTAAGPPFAFDDMPRFVDVAMGLIASTDLKRAMLLRRAGDEQRGVEFIDNHERVYTRRIFMRNQGSGTLNF